ncbi:hypothetical protein EDB86DRAFT_2879972 [Lactarius hatsudake]|nr:hypothetical protein EDB86DRAFT_2879972 [Lactarius hatsudake]
MCDDMLYKSITLVTGNGFRLAGAPIKTVGSQRRWRFDSLPLGKDGRCVHQSLPTLRPYCMRVRHIRGTRKRCLCEFRIHRWTTIATRTNCDDDYWTHLPLSLSTQNKSRFGLASYQDIVARRGAGLSWTSPANGDWGMPLCRTHAWLREHNEIREVCE